MEAPRPAGSTGTGPLGSPCILVHVIPLVVVWSLFNFPFSNFAASAARRCSLLSRCSTLRAHATRGAAERAPTAAADLRLGRRTGGTSYCNRCSAG